MNTIALAVLLACAAPGSAQDKPPHQPPPQPDLTADFERRLKSVVEEIEAEHKAEAELAERFCKQEQSLRAQIKEERIAFEKAQTERLKALWRKHEKGHRHLFDAELRKLDRELAKERRELDKRLDAKRKEQFDRQRAERESAWKVRAERRKASDTKGGDAP